MRIIASCSALVGLLAVFASVSEAGTPGSTADIQKALESQYALTKTTDDKTDIVTAGAVLVLQKDKLVMVTSDSQANQCPNTYKDGKLAQGGACKANETLKKIPLFGHTIPGADKVPNTRTFVTGEKFWVTKIDVKDAGKDSDVVLEFFSDPIKDIRYKGILTIPFRKGLPSSDDVLKVVAEVLTVAPSEEAKDSKDKQGDGKPGATAGTPGEQAPAASAAPAAPDNAAPQPANDAPPAAIPPPPPPPPDPTPATVSLGQTPEEVVAALGQPTKKAKVGTKEIYYYKDMKVVFVSGKVKDVQ